MENSGVNMRKNREKGKEIVMQLCTFWNSGHHHPHHLADCGSMLILATIIPPAMSSSSAIAKYTWNIKVRNKKKKYFIL